MTQITNKLIAQKRAALEDLSKTINGGWFSSGLIFSSLNIDNELAESSNEMFKEEKRLNAFLQSFVQYTPGVKRLEESVCWGLNIKLGTLGKAKGFAKTIIVDVGAGVVTCYQGCVVVAGSIFAIPVSEGLSVIGVPEGVAMVASGGNCALNRGRDLIREINGEWSEVGSTNFVKDTVSSFATKATGNNEEGNLIGVVTVLGVDTFGSVRGIVSSMSGTVKAGKSTVNGVNSLYNDYKMFGTSYKIINTRTNEAKFVKLVNTEGLAESALKVSGLTYNDTVQFYCAKTIFDDASPLLSVKNDELPMVINSWLRTD